jgi:hypothetical protein
MAIARVTASSLTQGLPKRRTMLAGNSVILPGSYDAIGTVTVGAGGQSTVSFTSIPGTYKHLQLRMLTRTNGSQPSWQSIRFNSSTTGYNNHTLEGNGSTASAGYENLVDRINLGQTIGSSGLANAFGLCIVDILDYANTNKNKTIRDLEGWDANGSGAVILRSGLWQNTSAITEITLGPQNFGGTIYSQYSSFALYGIK